MRALVLKGMHLALTVYGDIRLRSFGDIDLFVDRPDIPAAHDILIDAGYRLKEPSILPPTREMARFLRCTQDKDYVLTHPDGTVVELHWDLMRPSLGTIMTFDEAWDSREAVDYDSASIPGLGRPHLFVYLAVHGTKHRWSRLEWLVSFAALAARLTESDWRDVLRIAQHRRVLPIIALSLHLANSLGVYNGDAGELPLVDVPQPLVDEVLDVIHAEKLELDALRNSAFYVKALFDPNQQALCRWRRAVMPSHKDLAALPPPLRRWPFYYLIRPLRLAAEHWSTKTRTTDEDECLET